MENKITHDWDHYYQEYLNAKELGNADDIRYNAQACNGIRILLEEERDRPTLGGFTLSKEQRDFLSKSFTGEGNPMFGVDRKGEKHPLWGTHLSEEAKKKQHESHAHQYTKCHDGDGNIFDCIRDAAEHNGISYILAKSRVNIGSKGWGKIESK